MPSLSRSSPSSSSMPWPPSLSRHHMRQHLLRTHTHTHTTSSSSRRCCSLCAAAAAAAASAAAAPAASAAASIAAPTTTRLAVARRQRRRLAAAARAVRAVGGRRARRRRRRRRRRLRLRLPRAGAPPPPPRPPKAPPRSRAAAPRRALPPAGVWRCAHARVAAAAERGVARREGAAEGPELARAQVLVVVGVLDARGAARPAWRHETTIELAKTLHREAADRLGGQRVHAQRAARARRGRSSSSRWGGPARTG